MIPSLPRPVWMRAATALYVGAFLLFLFLPMLLILVIRPQGLFGRHAP